MFSGIREITWEEEDRAIAPPPQIKSLLIVVSPNRNVALFSQRINSINERQRQSYLHIETQRSAAAFYSEHFLE